MIREFLVGWGCILGLVVVATIQTVAALLRRCRHAVTIPRRPVDGRSDDA